MSNARNLANLLGTNTTIQTAKLADDAISSVKLPAGSILQVQNIHFTQRHHINSTDRTGLSGQYALSITPKFASSKILVQTNINCLVGDTNTIRAILVRNPSGGSAVDVAQLGWYSTSTNWDPFNTNFCHLDSPATTSALSYYVEWRLEQVEMYVNYANTNAGFGGVNDSRATITAMEIAQ